MAPSSPSDGGSPAQSAAWTLASLKLGLLELDTHSPLAPYDRSEYSRPGIIIREDSSESTSDSDEDEPLGLIRPQVKKWSVNNGFFISGDFLDDELDERDAQSEREEERDEPSTRPDERERAEAALAQSPLALYTSALIRNAKAEASMRETERRNRALELAMKRQRQLELELMIVEEEEEREAASALQQIAESARALEKQDADAEAAAAASREARLNRVQDESVAKASELQAAISADAVAAAHATAEAMKEAERVKAEEERTRKEHEDKLAAQKKADDEAAAAAAAADAAAAAAAAPQAAPPPAAAQPMASAFLQLVPGAPAPAATAASGAKVGAPNPCKAAPSALKEEKEAADALAAARAEVAEFVTDESVRKQKRALDKQITTHVQQISATQSQVSRKVSDIVALLRSLQGPALTHAMMHLAAKMLINCEAQVALQPPNAFPLAEVAMRVGLQVPRFLQLLTALLNEASPITVPKTYVFIAGVSKSEEEHFLKLGYRKTDGERESTDAFVSRQGGYTLFFGALLQVDGAPAEVLERAWAWLARALNRLPATRLTASSILNVLKMAGYRLNREYGRQFYKLLLLINDDFLRRLEAGGDPDARSAHTRIMTYLQDREFQSEPEGRRMPQTGMSDNVRA